MNDTEKKEITELTVQIATLSQAVRGHMAEQSRINERSQIVIDELFVKYNDHEKWIGGVARKVEVHTEQISTIKKERLPDMEGSLHNHEGKILVVDKKLGAIIAGIALITWLIPIGIAVVRMVR